MAADPAPNRRLFFALWPNEAGRAALAAWQPPLQELCGGKVMRADTLHCTLVFLGEVAEQRLQALCLLAQTLSFQSFELDLVTARYWAHNHIAYAAPAATPPQLAVLVAGLEQALRSHYFPCEHRAYTPHVTLLRHAQWKDAPLPPLLPVRWYCRDFVLVQSLGDAQGARYEVLCRSGGRA